MLHGIILPIALLILTSPAIGGTLEIFLPENASYRYVNATAATTIPVVPPNWSAIDFDDSPWFTGTGAFGSSFGADLPNAFGPQAPNAGQFPGGIAWSSNFDPYVRTEFQLAAPTAVTIWIAVDNGIESLHLNGIDSNFSFNAEGPAFRWEHVVDVPAALTRTGTNVLALQLEDHGSGTAFAMVVTSDDDADNPTFSTDCNGNGVADDLDIGNGTSQDCQGNGVPDECESEDCNNNGVPDECDIATALSEDANSNGVPDECECARNSFCSGGTNSVGTSAVIVGLGTPSLTVNDFFLQVDGAVGNRTGLFYFGGARVASPFGDGLRCVGPGSYGGTFRLYPAVQTSQVGSALRTLDFTSVANERRIVPFATTTFQFWYRDPGGPLGSGFNLSDGVEIVFCP